MRTCHLIETATLTDRPATAALLADFLQAVPEDQDHAVWTVGPHEAPEAAARLGLRVDYHANLGASTAVLRSRALGGLTGFDCVHAWTYGASTMTTFLPPTVKRRLTLTHSPHPATMHPAAVRAQRRAPVESICVVDHIAADLNEHALDRGGAVTVDPLINRSRIDATTRRALRLRAGVASDDTLLVVAMDEPPGRIDALTAMLAVGLIEATGRDVRLVIGPRARGLGRAIRVTEATDQRRCVIVMSEADEPWTIAPACDAALVTEPGLGSAWAMLAGLPVVSPCMGGGLVADETALLARNGRAGEFARTLRSLHDDRDRASRIGAAAAELADKRFDGRSLIGLYCPIDPNHAAAPSGRGVA